MRRGIGLSKVRTSVDHDDWLWLVGPEGAVPPRPDRVRRRLEWLLDEWWDNPADEVRHLPHDRCAGGRLRRLEPE